MAIDIVSSFPPAVASRRGFLRSAGGAAAAVGLFGAGPLVLLPRKAAAQSVGLDPSVMANLAAASTIMYQGYSGVPAFTSARLLTVSAAISQFAGELVALGVGGLVDQYGVAPIRQGARAVTPFDTTLQYNAYTAAQSVAALMSIPQLASLPYSYLAVAPEAQPTAAQFTAAMTAPTGSLSATLSTIANLVIQMSMPYRPNAKSGGPTLGQAGLGVAAGGVAVAGGTGLIGAGGLLGGAIGSLLIGSGVGLIFVGVAVAGYFAYEYFSGGGATVYRSE